MTKAKRTFRCIAAVLALSTVIAGAMGTSVKADAAPVSGQSAGKEKANKEVPEPAAALIGAIGFLTLLRRRR
jgi:hypothetical protein